MQKLASIAAAFAAAIALLCFSPMASAQVGNQPFAFGGNIGAGVGGSSPSVGMSPAYREVILERKLLGRSTANNFIRGADGSLVNVERTGDQAFGRPVTAPYTASQNGFSLGGAGYASDSGSVGLLRAAVMRPSDPPTEDMPAVYGTAPGAVPINSWIMQLTTLPELAS